jgi:hypothetical protein
VLGRVAVGDLGRAVVGHGDRADLDLDLALERVRIDHFRELSTGDAAHDLVDVEQVGEDPFGGRADREGIF